MKHVSSSMKQEQDRTEERRPSHADKRKALQRLILREEIRAAAGGRVELEEFSDWAIRLLDLAA